MGLRKYRWQQLEALLEYVRRTREESIVTTANVGSMEAPLGVPLDRVALVWPKRKKKRRLLKDQAGN